MCEVVSVNRLDPKDQQTIGWFQEPEQARVFIEERRKVEPLRYFVLFAHWSPFTRIATYHTM